VQAALALGATRVRAIILSVQRDPTAAWRRGGRLNRFGHMLASTVIAALPDFGVLLGRATRYCRERIPTASESAIRARFVRDSFHSLSTGLGTDLSRRNVVQGDLNSGRARQVGRLSNIAGRIVAGRARSRLARVAEATQAARSCNGRLF